MHDQAEIELTILSVIGETAPCSGIVERETEIVIDLTLFMPVGLNLPDFLDAETKFLRAGVAVKVKGTDDLAGQGPARAFGNKGIFGFKSNAIGMTGLWIAGGIQTQIAGDDAPDRSVAGAQHIDGRGHGENVDPEFGSLLAQPAHQIPQADNEAVARPHLWRHKRVREGKIPVRGEKVIGVAGDVGANGCALEPPIGNERIKADRVHDGARENMPTQFGRLFHNGHGDFWVSLLDADGSGQTGGAGADDQHVGRERFTGAGFSHGQATFWGESIGYGDWSPGTGCDITWAMSQDRSLNNAELLSVLDWYRAAGVDMAVVDEPVDRFAQKPPAAMVATPRAVSPAAVAAAPAAQMPGPIGGDPAEARQLAATAQSLEQLRTILDSYDGCGLKFRATQLVFADGNPEASIMLIGEAPGAEEDRQGKPFVGRSGQLLDRMLAAIGLDRTKVYIVNTVPWRPPGNRTPTPEEMEVCLPFLNRQVELVAPKLVMTLGGPAMQTVFKTTSGIIKMRGKWQDVTIGSHGVPALPTLHPAYLLRNPAAKQQAWRDLLSFKNRIDDLGLA